MTTPGPVFRETAKAMEAENRRRRSASVLAREHEARRMEAIRGEQARLKVEAAARRAAREAACQ